jgi:hypothetical protein
LALETPGQYSRWCRGKLKDKPARPSDIPLHPERVYLATFVSWPDWLGLASSEWRNFSDARVAVRELKLRNQNEWRLWVRAKLPGKPAKPRDIPSNPDKVYRAEWKGYSDWLGTAPAKNARRVWRSYDRAKAYVRTLGLQSAKDYFLWCKGQLPGFPGRPTDIPAFPYEVYGDSWLGMPDFLGTKQQPRYISMASYEDASAFVRTLGLKTAADYRRWCRGAFPSLPPKPENIPIAAHEKYSGRWKGWGDWLGTGRMPRSPPSDSPTNSSRAVTSGMAGNEEPA